MAKKKIVNEIFKILIEDYNIKDTNDIKDMLKDLLSGTIQTMLEAEIEHELGYAKHSMKDKITSNARNGHSKKTVRSEYGNIDLDIPRDRNAEFEPQIIPKYQREITGIEGQILSLYAKGIFRIIKNKFGFVDSENSEERNGIYKDRDRRCMGDWTKGF